MIAKKSYDLNFLPHSVTRKYYIAFKNITNEVLIKANNSIIELEEDTNKIFFNFEEGVAFFQKAYNDLKLELVLSGGVIYECEVTI